jgi:hypothetical protein
MQRSFAVIINGRSIGSKLDKLFHDSDKSPSGSVVQSVKKRGIPVDIPGFQISFVSQNKPEGLDDLDVMITFAQGAIQEACWSSLDAPASLVLERAVCIDPTIVD